MRIFKAIFYFFIIVQCVKADLVLVTHKNNPIENLSKDQIKALFLKKTNKIDGVKLNSVDSADRELYELFSKTFLNKSIAELNAYWARMIFTGKCKPNIRYEKDELSSNFKKNPYIITYIKKSDFKNRDLKIIYE